MNRIIWLSFGLLLALAGMLSACGDASVPAARTAPTGAPAGRPPTAGALATLTPAAAGLRDTANVPAATSPAPSATAAAPAPTTSAAIAEGLTPEGYHFRGRADAPVTLVMYSDFL
jgi:hypothetical protein